MRWLIGLRRRAVDRFLKLNGLVDSVVGVLFSVGVCWTVGVAIGGSAGGSDDNVDDDDEECWKLLVVARFCRTEVDVDDDDGCELIDGGDDSETDRS